MLAAHGVAYVRLSRLGVETGCALKRIYRRLLLGLDLKLESSKATRRWLLKALLTGGRMICATGWVISLRLLDVLPLCGVLNVHV